MDFSAILETIYTKEQAHKLMGILDDCISCAYKNDAARQIKEKVPHEYYSLLKPVLDTTEWKDLVLELRKKIEKLSVITLFTPYEVSEKTSEMVLEYVREQVVQNILVSFVRKEGNTALAIEWNGTYGEF